MILLRIRQTVNPCPARPEIASCSAFMIAAVNSKSHLYVQY
jgi:hypothetical protein